MSTVSNFDRASRIFGLAAIVLLLSTPALAQDPWVQFVDESSSRLSVSSGLGATDPREKDYAWGDVDQDGDIDLVIVRKQPFTSGGKDPNVLLLNQNGVLVDRTSDFATDSTIPGDNGFLTPTNDRDVRLGDLNNDGWLDMVTATTISFSDPKHIGHPRIYMNLGCQAPCNGTDDWLGFRHEDARIPQMLTSNGNNNINPCFCSVSIGDVTGDGYADLYFGDYDSGGGGAVGTCGNSSNDYNDKLLINQGASNPGFFSDATNSRFIGGTVPGLGQPFPTSAFGAANAIVDVNGDSINDIVKQSALNPPQYVGVAYNAPGQQGFFDTYDPVNQNAPYFVSTGELNNDSRVDLVVTDDGADRYLINQGGGFEPNWTSFIFSFQHQGPGGAAADQGFGSNSIVKDLDNDGFEDVLIADVDVDIPGCSRRMSVYRNLGGPVGSNVTLQEQTQGANCQTFQGNPAQCLVVGIPSNKLEGVHDVAVFDINGDGWQDMVLGRCNSTEVYINQPPGDPVGGSPDGSTIPGSQLQVGRVDASINIELTWGGSCVANDTDYGIYEGRIGDFYSHTRKVCTTGGSTVDQVTPGLDSVGTYYLIVPNNGVYEGGYGRDGANASRPAGVSTCNTQNVGSCDP